MEVAIYVLVGLIILGLYVALQVALRKVVDAKLENVQLVPLTNQVKAAEKVAQKNDKKRIDDDVVGFLQGLSDGDNTD